MWYVKNCILACESNEWSWHYVGSLGYLIRFHLFYQFFVLSSSKHPLCCLYGRLFLISIHSNISWQLLIYLKTCLFSEYSPLHVVWFIAIPSNNIRYVIICLIFAPTEIICEAILSNAVVFVWRNVDFWTYGQICNRAMSCRT